MVIAVIVSRTGAKTLLQSSVVPFLHKATSESGPMECLMIPHRFLARASHRATVGGWIHDSIIIAWGTMPKKNRVWRNICLVCLRELCWPRERRAGMCS